MTQGCQPVTVSSDSESSELITDAAVRLRQLSSLPTAGPTRSRRVTTPRPCAALFYRRRDRDRDREHEGARRRHEINAGRRSRGRAPLTPSHPSFCSHRKNQGALITARGRCAHRSDDADADRGGGVTRMTSSRPSVATEFRKRKRRSGAKTMARLGTRIVVGDS